jgi:hypothetical protein
MQTGRGLIWRERRSFTASALPFASRILRDKNE